MNSGKIAGFSRCYLLLLYIKKFNFYHKARVQNRELLKYIF